MINTNKYFNGPFEFMTQAILEQRNCIDDISRPNKPYVLSSINGIYTKETLIRVINCLFQQSFNKYAFRAQELMKSNDIDTIQKELAFMSGELNQHLKSLHMNTIRLKDVSYSVLIKNLNENEFKDLVSNIETAELSPTLLDIFRDTFTKCINDLPNYINDYRPKFIDELDGTGFKVDNDFIYEHSLELFNYLIDKELIEGNYNDFKDMLNGVKPKKRISFKKASVLGTLLNQLKEHKLIITKTKYLDFLTKSACKNFDGPIDKKSLTSNLAKHKDNDVIEFFKNIYHNSNSKNIK